MASAADTVRVKEIKKECARIKFSDLTEMLQLRVKRRITMCFPSRKQGFFLASSFLQGKRFSVSDGRYPAHVFALWHGAS